MRRCENTFCKSSTHRRRTPSVGTRGCWLSIRTIIPVVAVAVVATQPAKKGLWAKVYRMSSISTFSIPRAIQKRKNPFPRARIGTRSNRESSTTINACNNCTFVYIPFPAMCPASCRHCRRRDRLFPYDTRTCCACAIAESISRKRCFYRDWNR